MDKTVILMRAASGQGKSTWIKTHVPNAVVCSADDYFFQVLGKGKEYKWDPSKLGAAHGYCMRKFTQALQDDQPLVVVDNTNIRRKDYQYYVDEAKKYGYKVYQKTLKTRFKNTHNVPEEKVDQMLARFEVDKDLPEYSE